MQILIFVALMCVGSPAHAQIIVDYFSAPPATEAELFSKAVAVMRGRVEIRRVDSRGGPTTSVYTVRVLELFKSDSEFPAGGAIDVRRHGGFDERTIAWAEWGSATRGAPQASS